MFYMAKIGIFDVFCSRDLDLDLDPYSIEMYRMSENELPTSRLSKVIVIQTDRQTRPKLYAPVPRRFAGGQQFHIGLCSPARTTRHISAL